MKKCACTSCSTSANGAAVAEQCACSCGPDHSHGQDSPCGCAHDQDPPGQHTHNHGHGSPAQGELTSLRQDILAVGAAILLAGGAWLFATGPLRTALFAAAVLVVGLPIFIEGAKNILRLDFEEMSLMTIAVIAASVIGELPEALLVTLLFRIGGMLEELAVSRSQREVEAITNILPDNANLLEADGRSRVVPASELLPGSQIRIKSGERAPVDSVVLSGSSSLDTSSLTGESTPREVGPGDPVLSGSINMGGVLTCEATASFNNSTASKIVQLVKDSAAKKGKTERLISRFARVYTPIVIVLAILVAILPPLAGYGSYVEWISRALVLLVAACPCALVIAIPLSYFAGIGAASKNGVLVKGSKYLEALAAADAVVFDKTGTLTTGRLSVTGIHPADGTSPDTLLALAAACESFSNHPIAKAVVAAYGTPDTDLVESCEELTAYGMQAVVAGSEVLCGSSRLMERFGISIAALPASNLYVARAGKVLGAIAVADTPREEAAETIRALGQLGVSHTAMLTGDSLEAARATAREIGLSEVHAELLPADKVSVFERIRAGTRDKKTVLFVGDGINDSPVIARADAGVAMGLASDAAIEAADIVLLSDRLSSLPQAIRIARRTGRLARFNIAFALLVKLAVFLLALLGFANMWMAVFADVGVTILSVLNATRALRFR